MPHVLANRKSTPEAPGTATDTGHEAPFRDQNSFGEALYWLRNRRGLPQVGVARAAAISTGYYSGVENSKRRPPPVQTVRRIANALRLSDQELSNLQLLAEVERDEFACVHPLPHGVRTILARLRRDGPRLPSAVVDAIRAQLDEAAM